MPRSAPGLLLACCIQEDPADKQESTILFAELVYRTGERMLHTNWSDVTAKREKTIMIPRAVSLLTHRIGRGSCSFLPAGNHNEGFGGPFRRVRLASATLCISPVKLSQHVPQIAVALVVL